jgi:hypothetical protein
MKHGKLVSLMDRLWQFEQAENEDLQQVQWLIDQAVYTPHPVTAVLQISPRIPPAPGFPPAARAEVHEQLALTALGVLEERMTRGVIIQEVEVHPRFRRVSPGSCYFTTRSGYTEQVMACWVRCVIRELNAKRTLGDLDGKAVQLEYILTRPLINLWLEP